MTLMATVNRVCRVCHRKVVQHLRGPATCGECKRAKSRMVKQRYRASPKGQATTNAYEQMEYVKERRRQFGRSLSGRRNKAHYETTEKGRQTRRKAIQRYRASAKGKIRSALLHQLTKHTARRQEQRRQALDTYRRTEKGRLWKHRGYVKRQGAMRASVTPLTAAEWQAILREHNYQCHYCRQTVRLTIDHVIPLSRGGTHVRENVVPACGPCNSKKGNRLISGTFGY